ncbi:hypothetical protein [Halomonas sp. H5]|uniref:hypothetical protein n=1 Tax=Halomonas sp. H5 TaxID=3423910 RepID=UPI003D36162E
MSTAMKSKAPAAAESWSNWLEQLDQLQEERAEITGLAEARQRMEGAQRRIQHLCDKAWNNHLTPGDLDRDAVRGDEAARNVRAVVRGENGDYDAAAAHLLEILRRAMQSSDWGIQSEERRAVVTYLMTNLRDAVTALEQARDEVAGLEQARGEVDQRLEALEAKAPKASASSLAALRKERDAAAAERDRIAKTLGNMTADDSPLALAKEAEKDAQDRLDEAEALLAMGEAAADDVKAAKSEADKARKALEQKQADHRSQEAARRGMSRKLEQADSRLETLSRAYHQALGRMRHADLAALEGEMVAEIERIAQQRLQALAEIYADLEEAEPGSSYGPARLEVTLPYLHYHREADLLNRDGLMISAYGREE